MSDTHQKFEKQFVPESEGTTDKNIKPVKVDEVIETKDSLQHAAQAIGSGKMPTTEQITEAIDQLQQSATPLRSEVNLSSTGQKVASSVGNVLDSTKQLVREKNEGDVIQKLIYHAKLASQNLELNAPNLNVTGEAESADVLLRRAYSQMIVASKLIVTSTEFRGLLADIYNLLRDILKENIPGSEEYLPRIEDITNNKGQLDNEKVKKEGETTFRKLKEDAHQRLDQGTEDPSTKNTKEQNKDSQKKASELANKTAQNVAERVKPVVNEASRGDTKSAKESAKKELDKAYEQAGEIKKKAGKELDKTKDKVGDIAKNLRDFQLTDEQQEQLVNRLIGIFDEVRDRKEVRDALNGLIEILSGLQDNAKLVTEKAQASLKKGKGISNNEDLSEAGINAKLAVENFAGHHSLDRLINLLIGFGDKIAEDRELGNVMEKNHKFLIKSLNDNNYVHRNDYSNLAGKRFDETRNILLNKYREPTRDILNELQSIIRDLHEDPTTNKLVKDFENLTRDLFLDEKGVPTLKYDLLQDFQNFIPVIAKRLEVLELPRITISDDIDYILDNIKLYCTNIFPKTVRVRTDTEFDTEEERVSNVISVKMQSIQARAQGVAFYYKRKVGFINFEDAGLMDVIIPGEGLDIFLKIAPPVISSSTSTESNIPHNQRPFRVLKVQCRINEINVKFHYTKYNTIYKLFNRVIHNNMRRQIENMICDGLYYFFEKMESPEEFKQSFLTRGPEETSCPLDSHPGSWKSDAFDIRK